MIILLLTLCTSAAMDDCEVSPMVQTKTEHHCQRIADTYREILGPEINYRMECVSDDD